MLSSTTVIASTPPLSKNDMVASNDATNTTIRNVDAEKSLRIIGTQKEIFLWEL